MCNLFLQPLQMKLKIQTISLLNKFVQRSGYVQAIFFSIFFYILWILIVSIEIYYLLPIDITRFCHRFLQFLLCDYRQTGGQTNWQTDHWTDDLMVLQFFSLMQYRHLKRWFSNRPRSIHKSIMDRETDQQTNWPIDRQTDGPTKGRTNPHI